MSEEQTAPRWTLANLFAVPGTGKRTHGHYFRYPKSASTKRALPGNWRAPKMQCEAMEKADGRGC